MCGHSVNVTALPFSPYWITSEEEVNGAIVTSYSGTDYFMLQEIGSALNFTVNILPTEDWDEVIQKLEARESFIASVIFAVLPHRLDRYDFTYAFEYGSPTFSMKKPTLRPKWESLYYPFSGGVWMATLAILLIVPVIFLLMDTLINLQLQTGGTARNTFAEVLQEVVGIFLGQTSGNKFPNKTSVRILLCSWLLFSFIVVTVYKGNLTAYLTLPKYPPRAETLEELVKIADRQVQPLI
ncbi:hypothetical protein SK128_002424 [Halocaridina rubra]|uniref:Ionotropic glutamate receptor C-terminal domain-containing protein n=1 Tax=Halocaridina rubra TaxID=373956 RepID=A0AAN8X1B2_HALRR